KSLFKAILIIVLFTVAFITYYFLKSCWASYKEKQKIRSYNKLKNAEKLAAWDEELKMVLSKMAERKAYWAEIYIKGKTNRRYRLERPPGIDKWQLLIGNPNQDISADIKMNGCSHLIYSRNINPVGIEFENAGQVAICMNRIINNVYKIDPELEIKFRA
ncbi:MAG: hypothetical protein P8X42_19365, partial [Calditrichaceae bacterium]